MRRYTAVLARVDAAVAKLVVQRRAKESEGGLGCNRLERVRDWHYFTLGESVIRPRGRAAIVGPSEASHLIEQRVQDLAES